MCGCVGYKKKKQNKTKKKKFVDAHELDVLDMEVSRGFLKRRVSEDDPPNGVVVFWDEYNNEGEKRFTFVEELRNEKELIMWDESRKIGLRVKLNKKKKKLSPPPPPRERRDRERIIFIFILGGFIAGGGGLVCAFFLTFPSSSSSPPPPPSREKRIQGRKGKTF